MKPTQEDEAYEAACAALVRDVEQAATDPINRLLDPESKWLVISTLAVDAGVVLADDMVDRCDAAWGAGLAREAGER